MNDSEATVTKPVVANDNSQKSYFAIMLLAFFAGPLGVARIYRGDKALGWGRFWTFIASNALYFVGAFYAPILLLAAFVLFALSVWGAVDFFLLYGAKNDAEGKPLVRGEVDVKSAKILFVLYIIMLSLALIGAIITLIFWSAIISGLMSGAAQSSSSLHTY